MRAKHTYSFLGAILSLLLLGCGHIQEKQVLRLGHSLNTQHPVHAGLVRMAEVVDSISAGELSIKIYPSGQLGSESQCLELLQIGSLAMTKVSCAVMERFEPSYAVLSMPYLFQNREASFRVLDGEIGQELLGKGSSARLRGLSFLDAGTRCFYTKDGPVNSPSDLSGKKVRVQSSPMAISLINSLGGSPTPISWGELYTALQQGVVDAAENNLPSYYTSQHYQVTPHYTYNHHTSVPDVLVIGTATWDRLSEQEKGWMREAARIATNYQRDRWLIAEQEAIVAMQADTSVQVQFYEVDSAPFRAAVSPMYDEARQDPIMGPLLDRIIAAQ
ncbi:MAG: TRAP transporter substrate-binding protein [Bacteroidota bacterium]